jgi:surfactin synthase thioesterase subunit
VPGDTSSAWLRDWSRSDEVALRLLCLPPAGGSANLFRRWPQLLPAHVGVVAVELAGRGTRMSEPPQTELSGIIEPLSAAVARLLDRPLVIFGHSMGATLGSELCRHLYQRTGRHPRMLVAAGCEPPHLVAKRDYTAWLTDEGLTRFLTEMGGTPAALLANEEYMRLMTPVIRADLSVLAGRRPDPCTPALGCAVRAYLGDADRSVKPAGAAQWRALSNGDFSLSTFPGSHFFVQEAADQVIARLSQDIAHAVRPAGTTTPTPALAAE